MLSVFVFTRNSALSSMESRFCRNRACTLKRLDLWRLFFRFLSRLGSLCGYEELVCFNLRPLKHGKQLPLIIQSWAYRKLRFVCRSPRQTRFLFFVFCVLFLELFRCRPSRIDHEFAGYFESGVELQRMFVRFFHGVASEAIKWISLLEPLAS